MLIISQHDRSTRLERQSFADEGDLQRYLYEHPEAIPLDEMSPGARLHVLGREYPTSSGPIDALGTDQEGNVYLIETKLFKNPDKRAVLAQVLDYGAALWATEPDLDELLQGLRLDAARRNAPDPASRLAGFLESDEDAAEEHLNELCSALGEGRFTAIVLMDRLSDRLRDLISFMNENSRFRVLAVEFDYYRHENMEIVAPRVFGAEARRPFDRPSASRGRWNCEAFFERLDSSTDQATRDAVRRVFQFAEPLGDINWGSGVANPAMSPYILNGITKAPFTIKTDGRFVMKLLWVRRAPHGMRFIETIMPLLERTGLPLQTDRAGRMRWQPEAWVPKVDLLLNAMKSAHDVAGGT
jgi:hypothetical protein